MSDKNLVLLRAKLRNAEREKSEAWRKWKVLDARHDLIIAEIKLEEMSDVG